MALPVNNREAEVDALFLSFQGSLAGRYSLERELGRGGMGVVYLAREVQLDRSVAIKLLPPDLAVDPRLRERFMSEARMAARLSHPYIVPIYSVDEIGGFVFYTMAYVNGETLAQRVASRGPIAPHEATRILREVAWALAYAHAQGLVHRDIKPANILLEQGTGRAMVTDFGIARLTQTSGETAVGELLGTPECMSPEQAAGETLDGRSDLYSLGIAGYFALTGALPFTAASAQAVLAQHMTKAPPPLSTAARGVPRSVAQAIDRCLQKDPASRFATGEALADALAPARDNRSDIPVPVRVFLDRRRMVPIIMPPAMMVPMSIGLIGRAAEHGSAAAGIGMTLAFLAAAISVPLTVVLVRLRKLVSLGYGTDDLVAALRTGYERRREEFHYELGLQTSVRERVFRIVGITGLSLGAVFAATAAVTRFLVASPFIKPPVAVGVTVLALYVGIIATAVSSKWRRMRRGNGSMWMSFWEGKAGRFLAKLASFKLTRRAVPADRPTEMAIAMSAESLFASFPKDVRQSLGDVPAVLRELEGRARAIRARIESLNATQLEAQNQPARVGSGDRQASLAADITESRARSEKSLADVVTALENLRLDLLRLRAGAGTTDGITRDVAAARELGAEVDRLAAGRREVDDVLKGS
jgi:serine/threonine-protein kinase